MNKKFCLLLSYDSEEKIKNHLAFSLTQTNHGFIWRVSGNYTIPQNSPYPVYFFHRGIIEYTATCILRTSLKSIKADINLVPAEYRKIKENYKTWLILENFTTCPQMCIEDFFLFEKPTERVKKQKGSALVYALSS